MSDENKNFTFEPVGYIHCKQQYRYEAPRQAVFADNEGFIRLNPRHNFEQALSDLTGFDRIWVLYCFHLNSHWKPMVRPPVTGAKEKVSVFATRSPHRPNAIGMSCVELVKIDKLDVYIRNFDMLNETPVLDIKPYIPAVDSFPDAKTGWLEKASASQYDITFSDVACRQMDLLLNCSGFDLKHFCEVQLNHNPLDNSRKRVVCENGADEFSICYRTWQIKFILHQSVMRIDVLAIFSNYTEKELMPDAPDPYSDKAIHREFKRCFC